MTSAQRLEELRKIRAHLDLHCPGWRDAEGKDGKPVNRIELYIELKDGTKITLVLHQKSEAATETEG